MTEVEIKNLLSAVDVPADWVGLRYVKQDAQNFHVRDERLDQMESDASEGIMVELLVDGFFSYAGTHQITPEGVRAAAHRAYQLASSSAPWKTHNFAVTERPIARGKYQSPEKIKLDHLSVSELVSTLIHVSKAMNISNKLVSRNAGASIVESTQRYVSSNGSDIFQKFNYINADLSVTAQNGASTFTRSDSGRGGCYQGGLEIFDRDGLVVKAESIVSEVLELFTSEECPSETLDLVLDPDQMWMQIHESIGHPIELDRILGDERNYAGSSFVKISDIGHFQYGSELLNVTFDPTVMGEFASYGYDDGGNQATRKHLIKDGVLVAALGSLESQARAQVPGVANFRAQSWNRAPIDRMANINVEPGESNFDDIIGAVERGVYMKSNRSWSIDDYRNKFQFGCEYAKLIEDGKLTKTLRNPNYRGTSHSFWRNLKMVGDLSTFKVFGSPFCGKGEPNQLIRVGHASPLCLFQNVEVFGGN